MINRRNLSMSIGLAAALLVAPNMTAQDSTVKEVVPESMRTRLRGYETDADRFIKVEPKIIELGNVQRGDKIERTVTLTNISEEVVRIVRAFATCGCTVPKVFDDPLNPGESMEVPVQYLPNTPGFHSTLVRFFLDQQRGDVELEVRATTLAPIIVTPEKYDVRMTKDLSITLKSTDEIPFRVVKAEPEVVEGIDEESRTEHELTVSFERLKQFSNRNAYVRFYVDHPRTDTVLLKSNRFETSDQMKELIAWARGHGEVSDLVDLIDRGADIQETDPYNRTALMYAAQSGQVERVQALLDFQANVNAMDKNDGTVLMAAAKSARSGADLVRLLLDAGANVNVRDKYGKTALHWAARSGDAEMLQLLIERGAEVNTVGPNKETPLIAAVKSKKFDNVRMLVEAGADLDARDFRNRTAYDQAKILVGVIPGQMKEELERIAAYLHDQMEVAGRG